MKDFREKVVIITGSSMGIGKSLAAQLLREGARVVLNGRDTDRLNQTVHEFRQQGFDLIAVQGDVANLEDCKRLVDHTLQHYGRIDLLINNAGIQMRGRVEDTLPEVLRMVMDVNYIGALHMTRLALPALKSGQGGVVFVSSLAGIHGLPMHAVYSSSKMALQALAESLKAELTGTGVYVGIAYVGMTENEPGKTIYDGDGRKIPKETVRLLGVQPIDRVAAGIIGMIQRRQSKYVFSLVGKLHALINRISPGLIQYLLTRSFKKQQY